MQKQSSKDYSCSICDFKTSRKFNYNFHLTSKKHADNIEKQKQPQPEQIAPTLDHQNSTYIRLIITDVMKEMQTQFMEMFQKMQPPLNTTINHNQNSHNKTTFNMQVFLNEHCKDAMNLKDFVDSIQLTLADLDSVGERGFVEGISKIITNNLRKTDVHLRPIHCSDVKREVMYVKENNKWEKDSPQNDMIRDCIKKVEHKNIRLLIDYCLVHPDCTEPDSPYNDQYLKLTSTSTSGTDTMLDKIITRIANEVVVEKK